MINKYEAHAQNVGSQTGERSHESSTHSADQRDGRYGTDAKDDQAHVTASLLFVARTNVAKENHAAKPNQRGDTDRDQR